MVRAANPIFYVGTALLAAIALAGCTEQPENSGTPSPAASASSVDSLPVPSASAEVEVPDIEFGPSAVRVLAVESKGSSAAEISVVGPEGALYSVEPQSGIDVTCSQAVEGKEAKAPSGMPGDSVERVRLLCDTKKSNLVGRVLQVKIDFNGFSYSFESPISPVK